MIATGYKIPKKGILVSSGATKSKVDLLDASHALSQKGYSLYATAGTAAFLNSHGIPTTPVFWPDERPDAENNVIKMIAEHKFDLIVNLAKAFIEAFCSMDEKDIQIKSWQEYV